MPGAFVVISVPVLVDVDHRVGAEVDRVGAGGEAAVVLVGIEDLGGQGLPAAGRAAVEEPRPAGAEASVLLLEVGDQLIGDGVAVGAEVLGVDGVGVVVIRVGVLDLDDDHARIVGPGPLLVELVGLLLLDAVVSVRGGTARCSRA